ncbi:MAG: erythronate-4-phosphate dehydrogenase [Nitrospirales bacterium]|nr:MAG: erythronate-4-phosphate dehydrogenase [Nitrospirales bacterium]
MTRPISIVAGESIPYVEEAFSTLGTITMLPGRSITSASLQATNVLLIRSITKINETLLHDTPVEFVGSASAGVDHIDTGYLQSRHIGFASSPGSNANSVAEYVITALLTIAGRTHMTLSGKTIGIVGVGHIGKLVQHKAEALGMKPILNDPFLAETGDIDHHSLDETLSCDIVTLHVPFTQNGPFPTHHLINSDTLACVHPSTIFINASRGEVVDTQALLDAITQNRIGPTVIDVWEHEPHIHWELVNAVTIGTPHIAGHSLDGKAMGTYMIYTALCQHIGVAPQWEPSDSLPSPSIPSITVTPSNHSEEEDLRAITTKLYDLLADHARLKALLDEPPEKRATLFDGLRKHYPIRREFHRTIVKAPTAAATLRRQLTALGFPHV